MPETSLPVEHLFTFTATVAPAGLLAERPFRHQGDRERRTRHGGRPEGQGHGEGAER